MHQMLAPPVDLQPYVRFFWTVRAPAATARIERVIPDGCCELIWQLSDSFRRLDGWMPAERQPAAFVFGQIEGAIQLLPLGAIDVVGVRFTPGGVAALWGVDVSTFGPREIQLDELFPARRSLPVDQVRDACALTVRRAGDASDERATFLARCGLIATWLRSLARRTIRSPTRRAMAALSLMDFRDADIAAIARRIGSSRRGVERAFRTTVGLSPAAYLRLRRIDFCGRELRRDSAGLAAIAADAGYADHAHFSREFRQVVGLSPAAYRGEQGIHHTLLV